MTTAIGDQDDLDARSAGFESGMTFAQVQLTIERRKIPYATHPLWRRLEGIGSPAQVRQIAQGICFFALGFQDIIRLLHSTIVDPELAAFAAAHELEDRGHDRWFLQDLKTLGGSCDVDWLFSKGHQVARDVTYSRIADVLRSRHDSARFAGILALEAAGAVFFEAMIGFIERMNPERELKYFGRYHRHVEQAHDVFQVDARQRLEAVAIPAAAVAEVRAVVERTFADLEALASEVDAAVAGAA